MCLRPKSAKSRLIARVFLRLIARVFLRLCASAQAIDGFRFEVRPVTDRVQITAAKTQVARLGPVSVLTCNAGREGGGGILERRAHSRLVRGSSLTEISWFSQYPPNGRGCLARFCLCPQNSVSRQRRLRFEETRFECGIKYAANGARGELTPALTSRRSLRITLKARQASSKGVERNRPKLIRRSDLRAQQLSERNSSQCSNLSLPVVEGRGRLVAQLGRRTGRRTFRPFCLRPKNCFS